ncbi:MAG: hypothetical protein P0Y60_09800 [Candidatus Microbacterium colombiense]|nr:MAG: hypothetical protein P0Y60_09800 [Microbacterium sp.]
MNTTLSHSTTHPPDTEDQQVLQLPTPSALRQLSVADRVSFRLGLWLLERAQRPRRGTRRKKRAPAYAGSLREWELTPRDSMALATFDMQRQLR